MSEIIRLSITEVRNIKSCDIRPTPTVNVLYGENGSGKTSVLESIHVLASGKSFRSSRIDLLINHEADLAVMYAELRNGYHVGLSKARRQSHQLRFKDQLQTNWENVARELPVQLLDSNSFLLLEGGPRSRRRYLDWGVFHVEQNFIGSWRRSRKCIANRNVLLRQKPLDSRQLQAWDLELSTAAEEVDVYRRRYFEMLLPRFTEVYNALEGAFPDALTIHYDRGWESDRDLADLLGATLSLDLKYGATQNGPHRAELDIRVGRNRAVDVLSRGQQKVLVCALKIAQGDLLSSALSRSCIYLVDDLPAELDRQNRSAILRELLRQGGQLFLTCVEQHALKSSLPEGLEPTMFHVERGTITT